MQIHHIEPWAKVQEHTFENLILLCANCHSRVTNGEIDKHAVKQYKANLAVVMQRYGDLERRVLEVFGANPQANLIELSGGSEILMWYLLRDGYVVRVPAPNNFMTVTDGAGNATYGKEGYELTPAGREFIQHWLAADTME